jgi:hypothetical protein
LEFLFCQSACPCWFVHLVASLLFDKCFLFFCFFYFYQLIRDILEFLTKHCRYHNLCMMETNDVYNYHLFNDAYNTPLQNMVVPPPAPAPLSPTIPFSPHLSLNNFYGPPTTAPVSPLAESFYPPTSHPLTIPQPSLPLSISTSPLTIAPSTFSTIVSPTAYLLFMVLNSLTPYAVFGSILFWCLDLYIVVCTMSSILIIIDMQFI